MCISFETLRRKVSLKSSVVFVLLPIFAFLGISRCTAQQPSLLSLSTPDQAQVNWASGPADASLGTLADIKIPKGYRFTDASGAGLLLNKMNNPVPEGLVGILMCGVSTAFMFAVITKIYGARLRLDPPSDSVL